MQSRSMKTSSQYLVGVTTGALVLTCFGTIWGAQGPRIMLVITPVVTIALVALGLTTRQAAQRLPPIQETPAEHTRNQTISRRFGIVAGGEGLMIVAAVVLLRFVNHPNYIAPVICLIVGLHFLPLASLFQVREYALVGVVLSLLGIGSLLALLLGLTLGGLWAWSVVVGLSTAAILWLAALVIFIEVRRVLIRVR